MNSLLGDLMRQIVVHDLEGFDADVANVDAVPESEIVMEFAHELR